MPKNLTKLILNRLRTGEWEEPPKEAFDRSMKESMGEEWDPAQAFGPSALAFTKTDAIRKVIHKLADPSLSPVVARGLKQDVADLIKVIKITPKKATKHIKEFNIMLGKRTDASYSPDLMFIWPDYNNPVWKRLGDQLADEYGSMARSYAHESGHGGTLRIYEKVARRQQPTRALKARPIDQHRTAFYDYLEDPAPHEGAAEYIGTKLLKKAGLTDTPIFGYGDAQEAAFKTISQGKSKNPWMNVYRYFQEILK